jgi:methylated-DNA-[protein]-cysteine S-methyltransferase
VNLLEESPGSGYTPGMHSHASLKTPTGWLDIETSDEGVCRAHFTSKPGRMVQGTPVSKKHMSQALKELSAYFKGAKKPFAVALDLHGTDFQDQVWSKLYEVPFGTIITYRDLAKMSGYPRASRAVGSAMRVNPVCMFIPCHRVVPSSGGIGSYNGGEARKKWLLQHESNK